MNRPNAGEAGVGWFNEYPSAHVLLMGLKFDALAPIYLVHGIHDDGGAFEGGPDLLLTVPGAPSIRRFTQPLIDARAGFHVVRHMAGSIESGAVQIPSAISGGPSFGSEQMHLVCWSKGGLWTRAAIAAKSLSESRTLTTINTPHQGTYPLPALALHHLLSLKEIKATARILDPQSADLRPVDAVGLSCQKRRP